MEPQETCQTWLVRASGPLAGQRRLIAGSVVRIGRAAGNDLVIRGGDASVVSSRHAEVRAEDGRYSVLDLDSTNGVFVGGERVESALLEDGATFQLGASGPLFRLERQEDAAEDIDSTIVIPAGPRPRPVDGLTKKRTPEEHALVERAVRRAREARRSGKFDQTAIIMREMLGKAVDRSSRRLRIALIGLSAAFVALAIYAGVTISRLEARKFDIDQQIVEIESRLEAGGHSSEELEELVQRLNRYQQQARVIEQSVFYRLSGMGDEQLFIEREIQRLLEEFGAEQYSVPPEFVEQVDEFIRRYQTSDRPNMERALDWARSDLGTMREVFRQELLPPDLAYIVLVESAFINRRKSSAGAGGLWQFTPATARQYGLRIDSEIDERMDAAKSTRAAARYIRNLILDFGSGSSVMLALAAYNSGPTKVKRAIRRVDDPINQRNFWYLYRTRALPRETREYVPKILAGMIVGRNPERFGFKNLAAQAR